MEPGRNWARWRGRSWTWESDGWLIAVAAPLASTTMAAMDNDDYACALIMTAMLMGEFRGHGADNEDAAVEIGPLMLTAALPRRLHQVVPPGAVAASV